MKFEVKNFLIWLSPEQVYKNLSHLAEAEGLLDTNAFAIAEYLEY